MAEALLNIIRREIGRAAQSAAATRLGIIDSFDQNSWSVRVILQPEGTTTGSIPLASAWVGSGWGLLLAPTRGDQVVVHFQAADGEVPIAAMALFSDQARPPSPAPPSGEAWLVHQSGTYLKLTNDGKLALNTSVELDAGNLGAALHALVTDAFVSLFNTHTHPAPGGTTGVPNQQMGQDSLTSILRGN